MDSLEEVKKKLLRDLEAAQTRVESLETENDKMLKSKKKLQAEVEDLNVQAENQRSALNVLEKKQKKFDQNLAEEKGISERYFCCLKISVVYLMEEINNINC